MPVLGYGTAPLGKPDVSREHAERCLNHAIDRGITYLDTSPDYGSEPHVGAVMRSRRDDVFLATKVNRRSQDGVLEELKESLDRLQTSHVDLIQVHAVNAWADLEQVLAPDGAVAGLLKAREQGLVRFIGIPGMPGRNCWGTLWSTIRSTRCWSRSAWPTAWSTAPKRSCCRGPRSAMSA